MMVLEEDKEIIREHATSIVKKLRKAGHIAYFAGGWVRDHLLHHDSSDIDIATDAPPQTILDLFPHTILVGLAFGIVVVVIEGHPFEVATFRKDVEYSDGRRPHQIELSTPQEDAYRRDFTINGMFYDPIEETIYDFVGGAEDLKRKVIRTIGSPDERFVEDRLRMIRAIRFACRFDFTIDPETQEAIQENANTLFPAVAMERIWHELTRMSQTSQFDRAIIEMHRLQLLQEIFPPLQHVHLQDIKHQVAAFAHFPPDCPTVLFLLVLFPQVSLKTLLDIFRNLKLSNQEMALIELAEKYRQLVLHEESVDARTWAYLYADPRSKMVLLADAATRPEAERKALIERHQKRHKKLEKHIERIIQRQPVIRSKHLFDEGISQGELMGFLLKSAETIAISQNLEDPVEILKQLKKLPAWPI